MNKRYSRNDLVKMVATKTGYREDSVAEIYASLEEIVNELLLSSDDNSNTEIRLFFGLGLYSTFVPEHDKRMPDGEITHIGDSLKFQAKFSDAWKKSSVQLFRDTRKLWKRIKRRNKND